MFLLVYLFVHSGPMDWAFTVWKCDTKTLPHRAFIRYCC